MRNCLSRCAFLGLCCAVAVTAGRRATLLPQNDARFTVARPVDHTDAKDESIFRSAAQVDGTQITPITLAAELRDAKDVEKADAGLLTAIRQLEWQVQEVTSPSLRSLFAERARELLMLTSDVQVMRGRKAAALWFSDRARQVVNRSFGFAPTEISGDAEHLGRELVKRVPAGVTAIHQELQADQLLTWVIRDGEMHFVTTPIRAVTIAREVERFRTNRSVADARHLYDVLLRAVSQYIKGSDWLVYSPASALRSVPFGALNDGEVFLIERHAIVVTPSISVFLAKFERDGATWNRTALITLPPVGPRSRPLPGARNESRIVGQIYGRRATSLLDADATSTAFMSMAPRFDIIHIGTHGSADARPLQSAIEFGSERVRAAEIMNLRLLRKPVVVLAGCRTGDETEGRTTIGLSTAFVAAGASAVVGSLWDVEDQSTARLMIDFHSYLSQGVSAAQALSLAQKSAIARNEDIASWAAFQVQM